MKTLIALTLLFSLSSFAARIKLSKVDQKSVISVLKANEDLHAAFFTYKASVVESAALKVKSAIKKVKNKKIKMELLRPSMKLSLIKSSESREKNNEAYAQASVSFVRLVNTYDVGKEYNAYSCPMVKKKWVQNSKKMRRTHNPYAPEMPHCGGRDTDY